MTLGRSSAWVEWAKRRSALKRPATHMAEIRGGEEEPI